MNKYKIIETAGEYRNGYVLNETFDIPVHIHFIEKNYYNKNLPVLVMSPGVWEPAERAIPLFDGLDFHCISLSYRGRGKSDTPCCGYDLEHHVSDLKAVIDALEIQSFTLAAFSRGVGYACGYVSEYREKVKSLILVDHPPIHVKPNPGYAYFWKNLVYLGEPVIKYMRPEALDALETEAREVIFWDMLHDLNIPIAVLVGTNKENKIISEVSIEDIKNYRKYIRNYREINFEYSGHMLVDEELAKYRKTVNDLVNCAAKVD